MRTGTRIAAAFLSLASASMATAAEFMELKSYTVKTSPILEKYFKQKFGMSICRHDWYLIPCDEGRPLPSNYVSTRNFKLGGKGIDGITVYDPNILYVIFEGHMVAIGEETYNDDEHDHELTHLCTLQYADVCDASIAYENNVPYVKIDLKLIAVPAGQPE